MSSKNPIDFLVRTGHPLTGAPNPQIIREKLSEVLDQARAEGAKSALDQYKQSELALEEFRGQVQVHAAANELLRMKASMAQGICWMCKTAQPNPASLYRRCIACDTHAGVGNA